MLASERVEKVASTAKQPRSPISLKQVESVFSRSVAVFGVVFGAQTVPWLIGQWSESQPLWLWLVVPVLFGTLLLVLLLSFANVGVRGAHGLFAILYVIALASWPLAAVPEAASGQIHWLYYLMTVATAMAAMAFSTLWATIYLFGAPLVYLVIRGSPIGGDASWALATLEAFYSIILGGVILLLWTMLRQVASSVDSAQAAALDRYAHAVREHAIEVERVQVDSIVHDSVLTTFISAARAYTPEAQALAATMAGNAIGYLQDATTTLPDDDATVKVAGLATRISEAAAEYSDLIEPRVQRVGTRSIPASVSEAVYSATVQAMVNSLQHAGDGVARWVAINGVPGGLEVEVGDTGVGFDLARIPEERLGVRISMIERVAGVGGLVVVRSSPGVGTIVTIRWPNNQRSDS